MGKTSIQPKNSSLNWWGLVNQWQKQLNTYFGKGYEELPWSPTEEESFKLSSKLSIIQENRWGKTEVDELLAKQGQENVGLTPSNQEKQSHTTAEPIEKIKAKQGG